MFKKIISSVVLAALLFAPIYAKPTCEAVGSRIGGSDADYGCVITVTQFMEMTGPWDWAYSGWKSVRRCAGMATEYFRGSGQYHSFGYTNFSSSTCPYL